MLIVDESPQAGPFGDVSGGERRTSMRYDRLGRLVATVDHLGRATTTTYDALGRTVSVTSPDPDGDGPQTAPTVRTAYDAGGTVSWVADPLGRVTVAAFDDRGRLLVQADPNPASGEQPITRTAYNDFGQVDAVSVAAQYDGGTPVFLTTTFDYDGYGRHYLTVGPDPDGAGPRSASTTTSSFDIADRVTRTVVSTTVQIYDATGTATGSSALARVTDTTYDDLDRVREIHRTSMESTAIRLPGRRKRMGSSAIPFTTATRTLRSKRGTRLRFSGKRTRPAAPSSNSRSQAQAGRRGRLAPPHPAVG